MSASQDKVYSRHRGRAPKGRPQGPSTSVRPSLRRRRDPADLQGKIALARTVAGLERRLAKSNALLHASDSRLRLSNEQVERLAQQMESQISQLRSTEMALQLRGQEVARLSAQLHERRQWQQHHRRYDQDEGVVGQQHQVQHQAQQQEEEQQEPRLAAAEMPAAGSSRLPILPGLGAAGGSSHRVGDAASLPQDHCQTRTGVSIESGTREWFPVSGLCQLGTAADRYGMMPGTPLTGSKCSPGQRVRVMDASSLKAAVTSHLVEGSPAFEWDPHDACWAGCEGTVVQLAQHGFALVAIDTSGGFPNGISTLGDSGTLSSSASVVHGEPALQEVLPQALPLLHRSMPSLATQADDAEAERGPSATSPPPSVPTAVHHESVDEGEWFPIAALTQAASLALLSLSTCEVGMHVRVVPDAGQLKRAIQQHRIAGQLAFMWKDEDRRWAGAEGRVIEVDSDGVVRVDFSAPGNFQVHAVSSDLRHSRRVMEGFHLSALANFEDASSRRLQSPEDQRRQQRQQPHVDTQQHRQQSVAETAGGGSPIAFPPVSPARRFLKTTPSLLTVTEEVAHENEGDGEAPVDADYSMPDSDRSDDGLFGDRFGPVAPSPPPSPPLWKLHVDDSTGEQFLVNQDTKVKKDWCRLPSVSCAPPVQCTRQ
jgi:hypothetical protein